ncbi:ABC transporter ATP-binding protein [Geobacter sp. SVR]|uniref:ABC transporter ATP-binding protein n=1 Tax=Geobacter sp. SVR TaxID=2495594 RepID=UPI00143F0417|nr:ABC transporter ATP-binding protein [Geobacter sp. SVR]BCS54124.1 bacitracin ABC transporter ATP-binding protein [Geobacter sp. SVR]GCF87686.1 bacitracin ABC transporter ATP-binding protein [Geobacter sp. SVR]
MHEVTIDNVSYAYGSHQVLRDITLTAEAGDFICLLGPSGCGKSTLLRLLAGLSLPTSGSITLDGAAISGPGLDRGVVFQDYSLFPWMTAGQNIVLALEQAFPGKSRGEYREAAVGYLELVGLGGASEKLPGQMSGGMRQRAAIARAFAINSPVLLMDEPFGALDAITRAKLQDLLLQLWQQKEGERKTVFFVTHDVEEAILLANRIVVLGLNPGTIKGVFEVDLPRPRIRQELYLRDSFLGLRDRLVTLLHENILSELDEGRIVRSEGDSI